MWRRLRYSGAQRAMALVAAAALLVGCVASAPGIAPAQMPTEERSDTPRPTRTVVRTNTPRPTPTAKPTRTPRPTRTPLPTPVVITGHIADLIQAGQIDVRVQGRGLESLLVELLRLGGDAVQVEIPAGTYFWAHSSGVQNMVVRRSATVYLEVDDWVSTVLDVACANIHLEGPESSHTFSVQRPALNDPDLENLAGVLHTAVATYDIQQAAIWIVTDNASYGDLGVLVSSLTDSRVIDHCDAARAMQLVYEAGVDLTRKAIWQWNRAEIAANCADSSLADWLEQDSLPPPATVPTVTPIPTPPPIGTPGELPEGQAPMELDDGRLVRDTLQDVSAAHADLVAASSRITGETLEIVLKLRDVPPELTFNRPGVIENAMEYQWGVEIDVDDDRLTGDDEGFEYRLSAAYVARAGSPATAPLQAAVQVDVWRYEPETGHRRAVSDAVLVVNLDEDTLYLRGEVPGISEDSRLHFYADDFLAGEDGL